MLASRPIVSRFLQQTVRRYHAGEHHKPATMDELPVPRGSWQAHHDAKQRKYNAVLLLGIGFTAFTMVVAKTSGLVYLNMSPPKSLD